MEFKIKNVIDLTPEQIARYMWIRYVCFCAIHGLSSKYNFYCGITNNMDANYSRHKNKEFKGDDFEYVSIYRCKDAETAAQVEDLLRKQHFDCGDTATIGNGGTDDSVFVYMFKKP